MSEVNDRIEEALAAYIDHIEMGGSKPDIGHLSPSEREELEELIRILDLTDGVALGLGRSEETAEQTAPASVAGSIADLAQSEFGDHVVAQLREALPPDVRITQDANAFLSPLGGVNALGGWLVGTFGGRVRVWLLDAGSSDELKENESCLDDAGRLFRMLPDTAAIAMVGKDLRCLLVEPEDCAPHIQNPGGTLVGRRYRRPIQPVGEAVAAFLHELIPYWDEVPSFDEERSISVDVATIASQTAEEAIETQRSIGERARKGNPKKDALLSLGQRESSTLSKVAADLYERKINPDDAIALIEKLVKAR